MMQNISHLPFEGVAKSIKALNHEEHEGHKGKEKLFFVLFVFFVVPFFSELFATPSIARMTMVSLICRAQVLAFCH